MSKILLIEDDRTIREVVSYNLSRQGHEVATAADGVQGLRLAREGRPELILLDLMLPRLPGIDILRTVRDEGSTPVLVLSAKGSEGDRVTGLELGADDYLPKPFAMRELIARVEAMLRRSRLNAGAAERAGAYRAGGIEIDPASHEVRRDGERVALTPKEFALLEYLVRHPQQVLSRDRLLEAVWGYSYAGDTRTVDVHVHWLRRKLEADPAHPARLLTVRHYGYKFVPESAERVRAAV